ncbi:MAG: D-alanyl-D-alanine carboxypeptidase family protein [Acidimicrobiales bacterium]
MRAVAAVVALVLLLGALPVRSGGAESDADLRRRREEVRSRRAALAAKVDTLKASDDELHQALDDLNSNVSGLEGELEDTRQAVAAAEAELRDAQQKEQETLTRLASLKARLTALAVDAYARPPGSELDAALAEADLNDATRKLALLRNAAQSDADVIDQYRGARLDLEEERRLAAAALERAEAARRDVEVRLARLESARDQRQAVADQVEDRIEAALSESQQLATLDKSLSDELNRRQEALAAKLAKARADAARQARSAAAARPRAPGMSGGLANVRGIVVAASIADNLEAMLAAAAQDGIVLSGGGYRDSGQQVALRRAHCGSSEYAVYSAPASSCRPPTARPGASAHEQGLAIDFTYNGGVISSRSNRGFQWLARNAGSYGFYNLPSEPWHWSTTGR